MDPEKRAILEEYSAGRRDTRSTLEALDLWDYADIIIALAAADLPFPPPPDTPEMRAHRARAWELLMPHLLKHD